MAKFCGNCGSLLGDEEKFCGNCGAPVGEDTPAPAPAEQRETVQPEPVYAAQAAQTVSEAEQPSGAFTQNVQPQPAENNAASAAPQQAYSGTYDQQPAFNDGGATLSKPMNKKTVVIAAVAAAALVVVIVLIVIIMRLTRFQKIDAKDLIRVDFSGPNGYGTCSAELNVDPNLVPADLSDDYYEALYSSYFDDSESEKEYSKYLTDNKKKTQKAFDKASDYGEAKDMREALLETKKNKDGDKEFKITVSASKTDGLKNGDKVKITVKYDEETLKDSDIKLENTEYEVEVKGLADAETIDPYDGLKINYSGVDGSGTAEVDSSEVKMGDDISYSNYFYDLSNGDKISVTAYIYETLEYIDEDDKSKGMWFESEGKTYIWPFDDYEATKEYTVEGLTELTELDPFEGISFEYDDASPFLRIESVKAPEGETGTILSENGYYSVKDSSYDTRYKVGDKITVTYSAYYSLEEEGYKVKGADSSNSASTEITIGADVPTYASTDNAADALAALSDRFDEEVQNSRQDIKGKSYVYGLDLDDSIKSITDFELVDSYLQYNNATAASSLGWDEYVNSVTRLYKVSVKLDDGGKKTFYAVIKLEDVIYADGAFTADDDVSVEYFEKEKEAVSEIEDAEGYTVSKIDDSMTSGGASAATTSSADSSSAADSKADSTADSKTDSKADSSSEEIVP